jgi:hypothetical protein
MSKVDGHSDFTRSPAREEQRILTRVLGCGVEEFAARQGRAAAVSRVSTEISRAKRARSRKLHAFWSAVLVRIETETDAQPNTKPAESAQHLATPDDDDARARC